jgi:RNA polymerase sigma-70 factor (ECF subfamily)
VNDHERDERANTTSPAEDEHSELIELCTRIFGSSTEAKFVVRLTLDHWQALTPKERAAIESKSAWLRKKATLISADVLEEGRRARDLADGPEPQTKVALAPLNEVVAPAAWRGAATPDTVVNEALQAVREFLSPEERVSYVLHDLFGQPIKAVSDFVGRPAAESAALVWSARSRVRPATRTTTNPHGHDDAVETVRQAYLQDDPAQALRVLRADAQVATDGGHRLRGLVRPVIGAPKAARFLIGMLTRQRGATVVTRSVNGRACLVVVRQERVVGVVKFATEKGLITHAWMVMDPVRLRPWNHPENGL